jgi:hypothetical protein
MRLGRKRSILLGVVLAAAILAWVAGLAHRGRVDKNVVGVWVLPLSGGRWLWKINANGTYAFHSEAADGVAPHAGMFAAKEGVWSLRATNGYVDGGTYRFAAPDTLLVTGHSGSAGWHRLAEVSNDAGIVGTWVLSVGNGRWVWKVNPDQTYEFRSEAEDGIAPQTGIVSASGGFWWLEATNGYGDGGTYTVQAPDTLAMTGRLGAASWVRDSAWCKQAATSAVNGSTVALQRLKTAAHQGDAVAQDWMGNYLDSMWGRKRINQVDLNAAFNPFLPDDGSKSKSKEEGQAVAWWERAAAQGNAEAEEKLGRAYYSGEGVSNDDRRAVGWWEKAVAQGNADAQYYLGCALEDGRGISKDDKQSVAWWEKAAAQGQARAESALAFAYLQGRGVPKDEAKAVVWAKKAAAQGEQGALMLLSSMKQK